MFDKPEREAIARILSDSPAKGDGAVLRTVLAKVMSAVDLRMPESSALHAEWGRRKLAYELIAIAEQESAVESPAGTELPSAERSRRRSRRRGQPAATGE